MAMRYQPQGLLRIARTPLAAGSRLAILPGVGRAYDAISGQFSTITGTKPTSVGAATSAGFGAAQGSTTSDRVTTGLTGAHPVTGRSYFFRARRDGTGGGGLGRLFDKTAGATSGQFMNWSSTTGRLKYSYYSGTNTLRDVDIPGSDLACAPGEWFDVLATYTHEGGVHLVNVYVNGALALNTTLTAAMADNASAEFVIGNRSTVARVWDGLIECAYVWDRILSADDATALHANPYALYEDLSDDEDLFVAAASVPNSYTLPAAQGSYTITGNAVQLTCGRRLVAAPGSYSITGQAAGLIKGAAPAALEVAGGSYVITGRPAALRMARLLRAATGSYAITGVAAANPTARVISLSVRFNVLPRNFNLKTVHFSN